MDMILHYCSRKCKAGINAAIRVDWLQSSQGVEEVHSSLVCFENNVLLGGIARSPYCVSLMQCFMEFSEGIVRDSMT